MQEDYFLCVSCASRLPALIRLFLECEVELETAPLSDGCRDGAAVEHHGVFHDGQSQPRTAELPAAALVDAVETLEDAVQVFYVYAHAVVCKGEVPLPLLLVGRNLDSGSLAGMANGIVCKISEDAVDE